MAATTANGAGQKIDPRSDPVFGLEYGDAKLGKSTDLIFAFPSAEWIASPGALSSSVSVVGVPVTPDRIHAATNLKGVSAVIAEIGKRDPKRRPFALGIDDLTLIVDVTAREEEKNPQNMTRGGYLDGRKMWREVRNQLLDMRTEARRIGLYVLMNSHATSPSYRKDSEDRETTILERKGGPAIPGQMREGLPAAVDFVLRAYRSDAAFISLWPAAVQSAPGNLWLTGNRLLPPIDPLPMNMAEIIRASGRVLPEPFPGHSDRVALISSVFERNEETAWKALLEEAWKKLLVKNDGRRVYWIARDALARAQIRRALGEFYAKPHLYSAQIETDF